MANKAAKRLITTLIDLQFRSSYFKPRAPPAKQRAAKNHANQQGKPSRKGFQVDEWRTAQEGLFEKYTFNLERNSNRMLSAELPKANSRSTSSGRLTWAPSLNGTTA